MGQVWSTEGLWRLFESTGSLRAYLAYLDGRKAMKEKSAAGQARSPARPKVARK